MARHVLTIPAVVTPPPQGNSFEPCLVVSSFEGFPQFEGVAAHEEQLAILIEADHQTLDGLAI